MFKRTLATLALGLTFAAAAPAQEAEDLQFNKRAFQDRSQAIDKALDWLALRGYLEKNKAVVPVPFQVYNTNEGLVMVVDGRIVVPLGPGPFLPRPEPELERLDTLMNVIILRERYQEPVFNY